MAKLCLLLFLVVAGAEATTGVQQYLDDKIFVFYYLWYGNPAVNGKWQHWDHEILPHWTEHVNRQFPSVGSRHSPPGELHSPFFPSRGPYSSTDPDVLLDHMHEIKAMGKSGDAGDGEIIVVLSWWGQASREGTSDTQGIQTDDRVHAVLLAAEACNVSIAWHLEPYPGRSAASVAGDVTYLEEKYGASKSIYRAGGAHPIYFVYDSYHVPPAQWKAELLGEESAVTESISTSGTSGIGGTSGVGVGLRGRALPGLFVGLWLEAEHGSDLVAAGFDAFYTYFAASNFVYGSTPRVWRRMVEEGNRLGLASILSVGPGYADERIRPWNTANSHPRQRGDYYNRMFRSAVESHPSAISITSYNEWGEGTQIEPAQSRVGYLDYESEGGAFAYLNITSKWIRTFREDRERQKQQNRREL